MLKKWGIRKPLGVLCILLLLVSCSNQSSSEPKKEEKLDQYDKKVQQYNSELELEPLEYSSYSEEVGASLKKPKYKQFAVNDVMVIEGDMKETEKIKSEFVYIKVHSREESPTGNTQEYYVPIKDGGYKQRIHFFNGEGEYDIRISLPSMDSENIYKELTSFKVMNVNPKLKRDFTYFPAGYQAGLHIDLKNSYVERNEEFVLKGKVKNLTDQDTVMINLRKDSKKWQMVLPIKDGAFEYSVPLFFGKGVHELEVLVPDSKREKYFQVATSLFINNLSDKSMKPIEYSSLYQERGVTLETPIYGGARTDGKLEMKGKLDRNTPFAKETTHLYVTTKKGDDEALDVIPIKNYTFDDSVYLRFGPGNYEVMISVPEIKERKSNRFRYYGIATFELESTGEDKRDLLPSRGVDSDASSIITLAQEVTNATNGEREKTKAIYDYVAKNISYDVNKLRNSDFGWDDSATKTLNRKSGVCQDYAYLTIALLRASGIEARMVEGTASGSFLPAEHAWVEAKVDGNWLVMDPTWGSGYVKNNEFVPAFNEDYFEPDMTQFEKTHHRRGVVY